MNAGKSTTLLQSSFNDQERGMEMTLLKAVCGCDGKATMNRRVDPSDKAVGQARRPRSAATIYVALCRKHFMDSIGS